MGEHNVPLTIGEDGLVTSVGSNSQLDNLYETCVLCGDKTDVLKTTHIDYRYGYVEGSGQCCRSCYNRVERNEEPTNDIYIQNVMKHRTTLITITGEEILNTPNDSILGAKVRELYWSMVGEENSSEQNVWVCSICGKDTSKVDYDYLFGTDHIQCHLRNQSENK